MSQTIYSTIDMVISVLGIVFVIGLTALLFKFLEWCTLDRKNTTPPEDKETDDENGTAEASAEYPYVKTYLLTKKEWAFYKSLKPITDKYHLHILAKVRLADLVEVNKTIGKNKYFSAFAKIKSKHIDFVIARPSNLAVLCAIELDDNSHNNIDRQQRDYFIDNVCETVKLPLIRCTDINGVEDQICEKLKIHKK